MKEKERGKLGLRPEWRGYKDSLAEDLINHKGGIWVFILIERNLSVLILGHACMCVIIFVIYEKTPSWLSGTKRSERTRVDIEGLVRRL